MILIEQDKIKQVVKNAFTYMKENNLDFLPESYLEAFCKQAKLLNLDIDECNWFHRWSSKFDLNVKKELNNYPIKNKDDFITALVAILNNNFKSDYSIKVLEKALKVLKDQNIIDINPKLPLEIIDKKLTNFIANDFNELFNLVKPPSDLLTPNDIALKAKLIGDGYALICDICCFNDIKKEFGLEALEKLFNAFYRILLNSVDLNASIGVYKEDSIIILLPKCGFEMADTYSQEIKHTIENSKFVYENRNIDIKIHIDILSIKDLKI